ncbi:MAG: hypothetical protein V3R58_08505 [candidate division NC10 bacterium]
MPELRRRRDRRSFRKEKKGEMAERVHKFYVHDLEAKEADRGRRRQRYAKYRQWVEGTNEPWSDASDQALPGMTISSLHTQDGLHNAVMSARPPVVSKATNDADQRKQEKLDQLLDAQFFIDQNGEKVLEELNENFVNDGTAVCFVPWVKETRKVVNRRTFPGIPEDIEAPAVYFTQILDKSFHQLPRVPTDTEGWDWDVTNKEGEVVRVSFFTKGEEVEMIVRETVTVYDGPRVIVKDYEDVLTPHRSANLQAPGPSNPGGAAHVILVDYPTLDEIQRLQRDGTYDLLSTDDLKKLEAVVRDTSEEAEKDQKDAMQGTSEDREREPAPQRTLTRLMCFDLFDLDGDGVQEDVIWWMLKEEKKMLRVRHLSEVYPGSPPLRPLAEGQYLPVKGRREGIGLLELSEGLHNLDKQIVDQMVNAGTLSLLPFGFYRAASNLKQEVLSLDPGDLMPIPDPKNDINFPTIGNPQGMAYGFNTLAMSERWSERLTAVGDLQLGRVPQGKSSALRTLGGIQTVLAQGEARPERILRRYFMLLTQIWTLMHRLNKVHLTKEKVIRISGFPEPGTDPYQTISPEDIKGDFDFDFVANVLNSSKTALQQGLESLMGLYVTPLAIQMGISTPDTVYRLLRAFGKAVGQDPDQYLQRPAPGSDLPPILAEEALTLLIQGEIPTGPALEGTQAHLQKLIEFTKTPEFQLLDSPEKMGLFRGYLEELGRRVQAEAQQARLAQAAEQFGPQQNGDGRVGQDAQTPVGPNELLDEGLPTAGGGGNTGGV